MRSLQIYKFVSYFAAILLVVVQPVTAQAQSPFAGGYVDSATLKAQEQANDLYNSADYERAFYIYRYDLTPIGDKYAQYMVGFMLLTGTGVDQDPIMASAWYRLAAERRSSQFEAVRDELLASLGEIDRGRSDQLYLELRREYSDVVLLMGLIEQDLDDRSVRTGSRLSSGGAPVMIVDQRGHSLTATQYYRRLDKRIEARLKSIAKIIDDPGIAVDVENLDLEELRQKVDDWVDRI